MNYLNYLNMYGDIHCLYNLKNNKKKLSPKNGDPYFLMKNKNYVVCFKPVNLKRNENGFIKNDPTINYENFPWEIYYKLNNDVLLCSSQKNAEFAWNHWINDGIKENRSISFINNSNNHKARLGNLFFINMCLHFFSVKFDLNSNYKYKKEFNELGIDFFEGNKTHRKTLLLSDTNYLKLLDLKCSPKNIIINDDMWFQSRVFCNKINDFFIQTNLRVKIENKNVYKDRYENNNDLFVHVRLGDVEDKTKTICSYYKQTIKTINFETGYISSDNIDHPFCIWLINKYNLIPIILNEVKTIMFSSTCNNIVLSGGTFSWLIGFLAFYSKNIHYPKIENPWYGDIFSFSHWKKTIV